MAKIKIFRKDGTPTPFFWLNQESVDRKRAEVYKRTSEGIKRLEGVRFNTVSNRMRRIWAAGVPDDRAGFQTILWLSVRTTK